MNYLIEYTTHWHNGKEIGKDNLFEGDGCFYLNAKNISEAKRKARIRLSKRFNLSRAFKLKFDRIEETE